MAHALLARLLVVVSAVGVGTAGTGWAESIAGDTSSEQVEQATDLQQIKVDLALCAPHLAQLAGGADAEAMHESVDDPQCRTAILAAQTAGLSKAEIVDILMGAGDVPDPKALTLPHGGPPLVE